MKQKALNILFSLIAFSISYGIANLTNSETVKNAVLLSFLIHWILFIPAYILKTEKFFDLSGSFTYISIMIYVVSMRDDFYSNIGKGV